VRRIALVAGLLSVLIGPLPRILAVTTDAPSTTESAKLTAADGESGDFYGGSAAIDGDTIVVGAWGDSDSGTWSGSVYVSERNQAGADPWDLVRKITAWDATWDEAFGSAVAIDGDTLVVGAKWDDDAGYSSGSAYIFERDRGGVDNWGVVLKLNASDAAAHDYFGRSVAVSGDTAVIGANGDEDAGPYSGAAYVFERNRGGADHWGEVAKLTAPDAAPGDVFGTSVAMSGNTVVVGAWGDDFAGADSGSAYVFQRTPGGAGSWELVTKLIASDSSFRDLFGISVAINGNTVVVGAPGDRDTGSDAGSAYVFERNEGGPDHWGQVARVSASDAAAGDQFGLAVAVSVDTVLVGADSDDDACPANPQCDSGSAYVFERDQGGAGQWGQASKLAASDAAEGDRFGLALAVDHDTRVCGAAWDDATSGSAYVFERTDCPTWYEDADDDGYGAPDRWWVSCIAPSGYVVDGTDCDDASAGTYPGAPEVCDFEDNDCDGDADEGFPVPELTSGARFAGDKTTIAWDVEPVANRYDVVHGDLMDLRSTGGDFSSSLTGCLLNDTPDTQAQHDPAPGAAEGYYYLIRAVNVCVSGSYDAFGAEQLEGRDPEVDSSASSCP